MFDTLKRAIGLQRPSENWMLGLGVLFLGLVAGVGLALFAAPRAVQKFRSRTQRLSTEQLAGKVHARNGVEVEADPHLGIGA